MPPQGTGLNRGMVRSGLLLDGSLEVISFGAASQPISLAGARDVGPPSLDADCPSTKRVVPTLQRLLAAAPPVARASPRGSASRDSLGSAFEDERALPN